MLHYAPSLNVGSGSGPQLSPESSVVLSDKVLGFPPKMRAQGAVAVTERVPFGPACFYPASKHGKHASEAAFPNPKDLSMNRA